MSYVWNKIKFSTLYLLDYTLNSILDFILIIACLKVLMYVYLKLLLFSLFIFVCYKVLPVTRLNYSFLWVFNIVIISFNILKVTVISFQLMSLCGIFSSQHLQNYTWSFHLHRNKFKIILCKTLEFCKLNCEHGLIFFKIFKRMLHAIFQKIGNFFNSLKS